MKLHATLVLAASAAKATLVPGPTGPYAVAMKVQPLTDPNRIDILNPNSNTEHRRVLISMFLPVEEKASRPCPTETVTYLTPGVAEQYGNMASRAGLPGDIFVPFQLEVCDLDKFSLSLCRMRGKGRTEFPVVLFTPGFGDSRLIYGARARSLASQGFVVVTVDHPYDADVVEFPDGTVVLGADISDEDPAALAKVIKVRSEDLSFVIDQLKNNTILDPLITNFPGKLQFDHIAVYGHSLGGAAAAALTRADDRVRGGVNFDGMLVDPIKSTGLDKPFILAGRVGHASTDPTWDAFYPNLHGPRAEVAFNGTVHGSYLDILTLVSALDIPQQFMPAVRSIVGSVNPEVLDEAINGVLMAFFELAFRGKRAALKHISKMYPEVLVSRSHLGGNIAQGELMK